MKIILQVLTIVCIATTQLSNAENASADIARDKISTIVNRFFPEKSVDYKQKDGNITISFSTMPFQIHNINKAGENAEQPHEEIGPKANGFLIRLTHQDGTYRGAAVYPQTFDRPYWKTFGTVIPIETDQNHIHVSFSYGRLVPEDFVASVIKALESVE